MLCGPAGAGKTHRVLEELRARLAPGGDVAPRFLVLVPTYSQAEHLKRRLLKHTGRPALLDRGIATFEQLAERRTGLRLSTLAAPAVRDAILAAAFDEKAEDELKRAARFPGLRRAALRFLDEVKALEPVPGEDPLTSAAKRIVATSPAFGEGRARKVGGLLTVLAEYDRRLRAAGLVDHGDLLRALLAHLRTTEPAPLDLLAIDGFTDLTDVQEKIVLRLMQGAEHTLATMLGDPGGRGAAAETSGTSETTPAPAAATGGARPATSDADSPFSAAERLRARFSAQAATLSAAGAASVTLTVETLRPGARFRAPELAALERRLAGVAAGPVSTGTALRFLGGADAGDEADRVARTVLAWTTEGTARSEILVVARSIDGDTAGRVLEALARHGVAARRAGRKPLLTIPCARSALRVMRLIAGAADVSQPGDALGAVTCGAARGVTDDDADKLALRAREESATSLEAVERLAAARAAAPAAGVSARPELPTVLAWTKALRERRPPPAARPPSDVADALLAGLSPLHRFSFEGDVAPADESRAAEDAAAVRTLLDAVRDVVHAMRAAGVPVVTPGDLVARIAVACEAAKVAVPDLRDDAVNVVGAEEARQWEARAVVVCGLRLGEWPGGAREDLFLSDAERTEVERQGGLALPQRIDEALRRERLLFYFAATRARERVVFTAPLADGRGDPVLISPFLEDAMTVLTPDARRLDGRHRSPGDPRPADGETLHFADLERAALAALTERFVPGTESERRPHTGYALLPHLVGRGDGASGAVVREAARWFAPRVASLADGTPARARLAAPRPRSASSLQAFAQCAFKHFATNGLQLQELGPSADDGIDALTAGHVAHGTLERVYGSLPLDPAAAARIFDEEWARRAGRFRPGLRTAAVRASLRRAILSWVEGEAKGFLLPGFTPSKLEWGFGPGRAQVVVGGGDAPVALTGSADRIDVSDDGRAVVLDWKWSKQSRFTGVEGEIDEGADLQLPMYALAVSRGLKLTTVAVGYVTLRDAGVRWLPITADAPRSTFPAKRKLPEGWGVGDGSDAMGRAEAQVVRLDAAIRSGVIEVRPRDEDECAFCPFADLCRHDGTPAPGPSSTSGGAGESAS